MNKNTPQYSITIASSAEREILSLPERIYWRVANAIDSLQSNPRSKGVVKLKGKRNAYRIRVGAYRIAYSIDDTKRIVDIG